VLPDGQGLIGVGKLSANLVNGNGVLKPPPLGSGSLPMSDWDNMANAATVIQDTDLSPSPFAMLALLALTCVVFFFCCLRRRSLMAPVTSARRGRRKPRLRKLMIALSAMPTGRVPAV
jgi:hypothetical protein